MFLKNPNAIAAFDRAFREQEDGTLVFQRSKMSAPVPVSWEEYDAIRIAFEGVHKRNQIIWMVTGLAMGIYGLYAVIFQNSYTNFFVAWAAWMALNFSIGAQSAAKLVQHLVDKEVGARTSN